jgi:hypothetical protein
MWAAGMAGPNTGTLTSVIEHDDMAALARFGAPHHHHPSATSWILARKEKSNYV